MNQAAPLHSLKDNKGGKTIIWKGHWMNRSTCRIWVFSLLLVSLGFGCASSGGPMWAYPHADHTNFTQEKDDHRQSVVRIIDHDRRALIEDLDYFFLTDRPTRLTRWHSR